MPQENNTNAITRYRRLVAKSDKEFQLLNNIEKEADETVELLVKEINQEARVEIQKEAKPEIYEYARASTILQLQGKLKTTGLKVTKDVGLEVLKRKLEPITQKATKVADRVARSTVVRVLKKSVALRFIGLLALARYRWVKKVAVTIAGASSVVFALDLNTDLIKILITSVRLAYELGREGVYLEKIAHERWQALPLEERDRQREEMYKRFSHSPFVDVDIMRQMNNFIQESSPLNNNGVVLPPYYAKAPKDIL